MTFRALVLQTVLDLGECTISQVLAKIAKDIPAATAACAGRRICRRNNGRGKMRTDLIERGKRHLVTANLARLKRQQKIRRVRQGVYAPPLLKLFHTA